MKNSYLYTALLIVLTGLALYQSFFSGGALHTAHQLTQSLEVQLDTLRSVSQQYQEIHTTYEAAYHQLIVSQTRIVDMNDRLARLSADQQSSVGEIQGALQLLLSE